MSKSISGVVKIAQMLGFEGEEDKPALDYLKCLLEDDTLGCEAEIILNTIQHYDAIVHCHGEKLSEEISEAIDRVNIRRTSA